MGNIYPLVDGGAKKIWTVIQGKRAKSTQQQPQQELSASSESSDRETTQDKGGDSVVRVS